MIGDKEDLLDYLYGERHTAHLLHQSALKTALALSSHPELPTAEALVTKHAEHHARLSALIYVVEQS